MKDVWNENLNLKKSKTKKIITISIIVFIVIALITLNVLYFANSEFREWSDIHILQKETHKDDVAVINFNSDSNAEICAYDKYIGILSKNKFGVYNDSGKEVSNLDIPINNVLFDSSSRFLGIAEKEGQRIYMISGQNLQWENKIEGNISKISVNKNGYMAVVISDTSYKTVVSLYNPSGKELFKIYLSSTRVADVTISNDNKYMALAEIDTGSSTIKSNVKIISIENAQTDTDNSIAYIHNADSNKLLLNIKYQEKNKLLCLYDDSIVMIENENNKEILKLSDIKPTFATIELNSGAAIVKEKASGLFTADSEISFINIENQNESTYTTNDVTKEIYSCGNIVGINLGSEIHFVDKAGWLKRKYVSGQEISKVYLSELLAAIVYRDKIEIVNL